MKCLIDNIYYEARGESEKGKLLVAKTTLNRAEVYGSICAAVYEPKQFSWTHTKRKITDYALYNSLERIAYMSLFYNSPVYYFHHKHIKPTWANRKTVVAREGNHIFYK